MKRKWRLLAALLLLSISLALLVWGFWPTRRETRVTPIQPSNLTLPTPSSFFLDPGPDLWSLA
ncbi:MAG: hypothetical protein ACOY0R_21520 [Chloroflexota bacterium]